MPSIKVRIYNKTIHKRYIFCSACHNFIFHEFHGCVILYMPNNKCTSLHTLLHSYDSIAKLIQHYDTKLPNYGMFHQ